MGTSILSQVFSTVVLMVSGLFPIINPLGGAPIFLALTGDATRQQRTAISTKIAINSFFLLMGAILVGSHILAFFGISLPIVRVGGGLVVLSAGWSMLKHEEDDDKKEMERKATAGLLMRKAFYPLTLPLTVGPGSIATAIALGASAPRSSGGELALSLIAAVVAAVVLSISVFLCYAFADRIARLLGSQGTSVIMRLSAFLLLCVGLQIVWSGIRGLLKTL
jgi:multiple antibiotic resistance protein